MRAGPTRPRRHTEAAAEQDVILGIYELVGIQVGLVVSRDNAGLAELRPEQYVVLGVREAVVVQVTVAVVAVAVSHDIFRIRVGVYRVIYAVDDPLLLIIALKIGHRRDVYR